MTHSEFIAKHTENGRLRFSVVASVQLPPDEPGKLRALLDAAKSISLGAVMLGEEISRLEADAPRP